MNKENKYFTRENLYAVLISTVTFFIFFYKLLLPNYWVYGSDAQIMHLPIRQYLYDSITLNRDFPFWTEKAYGGFPMYKNPEFQYLNPINVLSILLFGPTISFKVLLFTSYYIGSLSLWLFIKRKGLTLWGYFCANVIYYFSFFLINHLIHFNIILSAYLLPTVLLLQDILIEKKSFKNIIGFSLLLSYIAYCGHTQMTFFVYLACMLYFMISIKSIYDAKNITLLSVYVFLIVFFLTLPLNIATYNLSKDSVRGVDPVISYAEGTYLPPLFLNTFIPLMYKNFQDFTARDLLNKFYTYTEMYTYMGISALLVGLIGFLFTKKDRLSYFSYSLVLLFIFFASVGQLTIFQHAPIITLFRHWERSVFLANLGVGLIIAQYFSKNSEFSFKSIFSKINVILISVPLLYFIFLIMLTSHTDIYQAASKYSILLPKIHRVWKVIVAVTIVSIIMMRVKKLRYFAILLFCLALLIDLRYYVNDALENRIKYIGNPIPIIYIKGFDNTRIVDTVSDVDGMQFINANYFSLFGYSQLVNKTYRDELKQYGYSGNITNPHDSTTFDDNLKNTFGVKALITPTGIIYSDYDNPNYSILQNNEHYKKIKTLNNNNSIVTSIRCDDGWVVKINGNKITPNCTYKDLFISVKTNGTIGDIIEFTYIPYPLYITFIVSCIGLLLIFSLRKKLIRTLTSIE